MCHVKFFTLWVYHIITSILGHILTNKGQMCINAIFCINSPQTSDVPLS